MRQAQARSRKQHTLRSCDRRPIGICVPKSSQLRRGTHSLGRAKHFRFRLTSYRIVVISCGERTMLPVALAPGRIRRKTHRSRRAKIALLLSRGPVIVRLRFCSVDRENALVGFALAIATRKGPADTAQCHHTHTRAWRCAVRYIMRCTNSSSSIQYPIGDSGGFTSPIIQTKLPQCPGEEFANLETKTVSPRNCVTHWLCVQVWLGVLCVCV